MSVNVIVPCQTPKVSIIIPSIDGQRAGNVPRLIEQIRAQNLPAYELLLVAGESPNGHARNVGARCATGHLLVFIDDDAILGDTETLANVLRPVEHDPSVGMSGASTLIPPDSNWFQRWVAAQQHGATYPVVNVATETRHGATHLCCAFRRSTWQELGGENDDLVTGTDLDMRDRVRKAGLKVVLAPRCFAYHPLPPTLRAYLRSVFRYGAGAPLFLRQCPALGRAPALTSSLRRASYVVTQLALVLPSVFLHRDPISRHIGFRWHPVAALSRLFYAAGYYWGWRQHMESGSQTRRTGSFVEASADARGRQVCADRDAER